MPGMVMTPTTEEWRQLGGQLSELADLRAREEEPKTKAPFSSNGDITAHSATSSSSSSSIDLISMTRSNSHLSSFPPASASTAPPPPRPPAKPLLSSGDELDPPTPPIGFKSIQTSFSYQSFSHNKNSSYSSINTDHSSPVTSPATNPLPSRSTFAPSHKPTSSESSIRPPALSRGSLATQAGTGALASPVSTPAAEESFTLHQHGHGDDSGETPVPLDRISSMGPVDPRKYSAVTGLRSIDSFVIEGEAGTGAYGTVRKARLKGPDGLPTGPELIIKYVIKQRILADCWKKHKILGPIPVEVHVLDHLRRVTYVARPLGRKDSPKLGKPPRRDSAPSSIKEGSITGHPNVCGMLDFFEDAEFYYVVMLQAGADPDNPNAPGGHDLFDYVDMYPEGLPTLSIRSILTQIADAMQFLHEHGIVHRDLKDENIVLDHHGHVQLIDFGSAAYVSKDGKKFDTFSGTLDFAAPEVLKGQRYGGRETDLWAFGVLTYVLICGECPFWSPVEAMEGLAPGSRAEQALKAKINTAVSTSASLPAPVEALPGSGKIEDGVDLVMRCLEVDPGNRPTADEVLNHKFILGETGWTGRRGWEQTDSEEEED